VKGGERTFMFASEVDNFRMADNLDDDAIAVASDRGIPDFTPQFESMPGNQISFYYRIRYPTDSITRA
jgi:hypothetical protein